MNTRRLVASAALALVAPAASLSAQYMPVGPQQNVALSTITGGGWTQCYASTMATPLSNTASEVLSACSGTYLMMAGRATGSSNILLLAAGSLAGVTTPTSGNATNAVNGSEWYFWNGASWGFAPLGATVSLSSCDVAGIWAAGTGSDQRMCLHTDAYSGGWRIGNTANLNGSTDYEKLFFVSEGQVTPPVTAAPEPASLALLGTGLVGLGIAARRKRRASA